MGCLPEWQFWRELWDGLEDGNFFSADYADSRGFNYSKLLNQRASAEMKWEGT